MSPPPSPLNMPSHWPQLPPANPLPTPSLQPSPTPLISPAQFPHSRIRITALLPLPTSTPGPQSPCPPLHSPSHTKTLITPTEQPSPCPWTQLPHCPTTLTLSVTSLPSTSRYLPPSTCGGRPCSRALESPPQPCHVFFLWALP